MCSDGIPCVLTCVHCLVVLSLRATEKSLAAPSSFSPIRYLVYIVVRSPPSLFFTRLKSSSSLSLSYMTCATPTPVSRYLPCTGEPRTRHSTPDASSSVLRVERKDHLPQPASKALAFAATRVHCWLTVSLLSTRTPTSSSAKLLSSQSAPRVYYYLGLFLRGQDFALTLVELRENPLSSSPAH